MNKKRGKKVFKMAGRRPARGSKDDESSDEDEPFTEVSASESFNPLGVGVDDDDEINEPNTRKLVAAQNRKKKKSGGFQSMGLSFSVYKGVMKKGYRVPTPIQRKTIPIIMDGKDVVAMARTGSGKTAAFLVPLFEKLQQHSAKAGARALVLSPTRELAMQTLRFCKELGKYSDLKSTVILGGDKMEDQFAKIHENPDIIIATPGRFLHVVVEMNLKLNFVEYVVFDEADRLFEMGFSEQLLEIISRLPDSRQTLLFSATLPKLLVDFARAGLHDPVLIRLDVDTKVSEQLKIAFFSVRADDKPAVLLHLLRNVVKPTEQTIVFAATRHHVEYLKELLTAAGISSSCVYSTLDQTARKINIGKFQNKKTMVLIVTDVAARGIDIPMLDNVINYNFPAKPKLFVHRVGRVARAGLSGTSYSLVGNDELAHMLDLHLFLGRPLKIAPVKDDDSDCLCGSVPQNIIDEEEDFLRVAHQQSVDLETIKKVATNAYKHYLKTRPPPSAESVKRMKEFSAISMGAHPILGGSGEMEIKRTIFVDGVKNYKPSLTVFEVGNKLKKDAFSIMRNKRNYHTKVIERNLQHKQEVVSAHERDQSSSSSGQGLVQEADIQGVFSRVFNPSIKRKNTFEQGSSVRDENYIPHKSLDDFTEKGLGVKAFEKEAGKVMLDIGGDDQQTSRKNQTQKKWDRKRKRFVSTGGGDKKKIKTESGRYIPASYKSNLYKEWMSKNNVDRVVGEDDEEERANTKMKGKGKFKGKQKRGPASRGPASTKNEMMTKDQILKQRKQKQKILDRQKSGWEKNKKRKGMKGRKGGTGR